ncbi:fluoride efflux transporter FluC [Lacticaseibacillus absianus]|uniref:fluoride efflux transporter FluC n=1 Tax=Lacticaseibacillus absianus TaxID=2729623 RepID=UPI0015C82529|nr:CrcB family protein [Lacticaseibacillus absianus]
MIQTRIPLAGVIAVFVGGMGGGVARAAVGWWLHDSQTLMGTTTVNLLGSFGLAWLTYGLSQRAALPEWLMLGLGTGFIGAFTTFSSLVLAAVQTVATRPVIAGAVLALNLGGGALAAWAGRAWGQRRWAR